MNPRVYISVLLTALLVGRGLAADGTKKQPNVAMPNLTVVLDGQLMTTKAHLVDAEVYVNLNEIGKALNWNVQASDSTVAIKTSHPAPPALVNAKISGTITYFFNNNYGNKPDTGSMVWLSQGESQLALQLAPQIYYADQSELRVTSRGEPVSLPVILSSTVDGNGRYEMGSIKPGKYTLVIRSSHTGKAFSTNINVRSDESRDVSYDFGIALSRNQ